MTLFLYILKRIPLFLFLILLGCTMPKTPSKDHDTANELFSSASNLISSSSSLYEDTKGFGERSFFLYPRVPLVQYATYSLGSGNYIMDFYQSDYHVVHDTTLYGMFYFKKTYNTTKNIQFISSHPDIRGNLEDGFFFPTSLVKGTYFLPFPTVSTSWSSVLDGKKFCLVAYEEESLERMSKICDVFSPNSKASLDLRVLKNKNALVYLIFKDDKEYIKLPSIHWRSPTPLPIKKESFGKFINAYEESNFQPFFSNLVSKNMYNARSYSKS